MRKVLLLLSLITLPLFAQLQDTSKAYVYDYVMPIWGQKAADRGIKLQLPYGFNINYVYNKMDLEISRFGMSVGDDPNSDINQALEKYVNMETLNFQKTEAISNGINLRADVWLFPFWSAYILYSGNEGQTSVSLQPQWYDDNGDLVLSLPQFGSTVDFRANTYGIGSTFAYGIDKYFLSADVNYTQSYSEILTDPAQFLVASIRVGERIQFKNGMKLSPYVGAMYRGFVESNGNIGSIGLSEVFPDIGSQILPEIDDRITSNNDKIAGLDPNKPADQIQIAALEKKNDALYQISGTIEQAIGAEINYEIEKDIINHWTVEFGFNFEISDNWTFRGEYGVGTGNVFVMTGLQYRFGIGGK